MANQKKQRPNVQTTVASDGGGMFVQWFDLDTEERVRWYAGRVADPRAAVRDRILQGPPADGWAPILPISDPPFVIPALDLTSCTLAEAIGWNSMITRHVESVWVRVERILREAPHPETRDLALVLRESCLSEGEVVTQAVRARDRARSLRDPGLEGLAIDQGDYSRLAVSRRVASLRVVARHVQAST